MPSKSQSKKQSFALCIFIMVIPFGVCNTTKCFTDIVSLILRTSPVGGVYFYLHFAYGKTEAQRVSAVCLGSTPCTETPGSQPEDESYHSSDDRPLSNLPFFRYRNSSRRTFASLKFYLQVPQEKKSYKQILLIPLHLLNILLNSW